MKKFVYVIGAIVLMSNISCKKNADGNKGVIVENSAENTGKVDSLSQEITDRYVAEDGSSALITFKTSGEEKSISISSNKMTIKAPQTEALANGGIYKDHDYEIVAKNDSVTITQGDNVIMLKKARGTN